MANTELWTKYGQNLDMQVQCLSKLSLTGQGFYTLYMDRHWTEIEQSLDKDWILCPMFVWPHPDQEYQ